MPKLAQQLGNGDSPYIYLIAFQDDRFIVVQAGITHTIDQIGADDVHVVIEIVGRNPRDFRQSVLAFPGALSSQLPSPLDHPGASELGLDLLLFDAIEDRRNRAETKSISRPAQVELKNLPDVHAAGNAKRVEDDFHRRAVGKVRHVFNRNDL